MPSMTKTRFKISVKLNQSELLSQIRIGYRRAYLDKQNKAKRGDIWVFKSFTFPHSVSNCISFKRNIIPFQRDSWQRPLSTHGHCLSSRLAAVTIEHFDKFPLARGYKDMAVLHVIQTRDAMPLNVKQASYCQIHAFAKKGAELLERDDAGGRKQVLGGRGKSIPITIHRDGYCRIAHTTRV